MYICNRIPFFSIGLSQQVWGALNHFWFHGIFFCWHFSSLDLIGSIHNEAKDRSKGITWPSLQLSWPYFASEFASDRSIYTCHRWWWAVEGRCAENYLVRGDIIVRAYCLTTSSYIIQAVPDTAATYEQLRTTIAGSALQHLISNFAENVHHPAIVAAIL